MKTLRSITEEDVAINFRQPSSKAVEKHHDDLNRHYIYREGHHLKAIHEYSSGGAINGFLWEKHKNPDHKDQWYGNEHYHKQTENMDRLINHEYTPKSMVVWSKTIHDPRKMMNEKGVVHHPAYLSTSINPKIAKGLEWNETLHKTRETDDDKTEYHHHILKIHVPKYHPGAYLGEYSHYPNQKEFVLPRGTNLKYRRTSEEPGLKPKYDSKTETHRMFIHHMTIEPSE